MNLNRQWDRTLAVAEALPEDPAVKLLENIGLPQSKVWTSTSPDLYQRRVGQLISQHIRACDLQTPIYEAAGIMSQQNISCLFVQNDQQHMVGYVTDSILRDSVVAQKADVHQPVCQVMETALVTVDSQTFVMEAMLLMFQTGTQYLLVKEQGKYLGVLSQPQLLSEQSHSTFAFMSAVRQATHVEQLKQLWEQVPEVVMHLFSTGVPAEFVNQAITTVSDTITQKIIEGVIEELGTPPARFTFMALGSEGRREQTLKTDQDNAIIYEDTAPEQREDVRVYFPRLATLVSDRLHEVGFDYCTGGFMAKNPEWTHSLSHWKRNYERWLQTISPETVMHFAAFFDGRFIYGDTFLIEELKHFQDQLLQAPLDRFLYYMANNALQYEPPLTFFNNFRTFSKGSQQVFNLKKTMTPIVDLVRVYALQQRIFLTHTVERMEALKNKGVFSEKEYQELRQAYCFLMDIRLKKQARQIISEGTDPDNYLDPKSLTIIEQATLKAICRIIENFQLKIKINFTKSLFG